MIDCLVQRPFGGAEDRQHGGGGRAPVTLHDCIGADRRAAAFARRAPMTLPNVKYQEAVRAYFTGWYTEVVDAVPRVENGRVTPLPGAGPGPR
jgi:hypothetical protein